MPTSREKPRRRSPRLQGYDYSQNGAYFVTICTQHRVCLFGEVVDGEMRLNDAGRMVELWWLKLPGKFPEVDIDLFVVMPNHFHGIVVLGTTGPVSAPLYTHLQWFKTMTTNAYIRGVKERDWETFPGKLWQRSFHDHIIRSEKELNTVREYILDNPARWEDDTFHPAKPFKSDHNK